MFTNYFISCSEVFYSNNTVCCSKTESKESFRTQKRRQCLRIGFVFFLPPQKNTLGHGGGSLLSPLVREKEVGMGGGSTTDLLAWVFFCPPSKERVGRGRGVIPGDPSSLHASLLPKK